MSELTEGDMAPQFTLDRSGGGSITLESLRGKNVVLYFYPKDDTSGCTKEACGFRDSYSALSQADTVVLGVSPDDVPSHDRFAEKYQLPFGLLADPDHVAAEAYGVWKEKNMYGKRYMGIERSTFLIDKEGRLRKIWRGVRPDGHAEDVLAAVQVGS